MSRMVLIGAPCWTQKYPFYSLAVVAGIALDNGFSCAVYDMNIDFYNYLPLEEKKNWDDDMVVQWAGNDLPSELIKKHKVWLEKYLCSIVEKTDIELVCFSVNTYTRYFSIWAAAFLRAKRPDIPIMFGGVDCFVGEYNNKFLTERNCDIICHGEAEIAFRNYLEEFKKTGQYKNDVKGFAYLAQDLEVVDNGESELPKLRKGDVPLPDYSQFDFSKYTEIGSMPIFSSRGCINRCNFCSESPNFKYYRFRKAEDIFRELRHAYSYVENLVLAPTFHFADSLINGNTKELERFCDMIIESGLVIRWGGQAAIRSQMTTTLLKKMAHSGYTSFFWGMESASDNVLKLMNKPNDISLFERILEDCNKLGIVNYTPIIVGYPGETPRDTAITLNFILRNKERSQFMTPGLALARRKSPLYEHYSEFGLKEAKEYDWETVDGKNTIQVRVFRRFLFSQACFNTDFSLDGLVDYKEIAVLDMNSTVVAEDYINILYQLARMTGTSRVLEQGLQSIFERDEGTKETSGDCDSEFSLVPGIFGRIKRNIKSFSQFAMHRFEKETGKQLKAVDFLESAEFSEYMKSYLNLDKNKRGERIELYKMALKLFKAVHDSKNLVQSMTSIDDTSSCTDATAEKWGSEEHSYQNTLAQGWCASPIVLTYRSRMVTGADDGNPSLLIVDHLAPQCKSGKVLVLGCGQSFAEHWLAASKTAQFAHGIDVSPGAIEKARAEVVSQSLNGRVTHEIMDINKLSLSENSYDGLLISQAMHHFENLEHICAELTKGLKPGAPIVIDDFVGPTRFQYSDERLDLMNRLLACLPPHMQKPPIERIPIESFLKTDPSEGVRCDEIPGIIQNFFEIERALPYGGSIIYQVLQDIVQKINHDDPRDTAIVNLLVAFEENLIKTGAMESDFMMFFARNSKIGK